MFAGRAAAPGSASSSPTLPLTLCSDPPRPGLECAPVRDRRRLRRRRVGVRQRAAASAPPTGSATGELTALIQTRHSAALTGLPVTPASTTCCSPRPTPAATSTRWSPPPTRGLLLTCLWYIREVDPQTLLLTGLTRDGVYLVENGEVVGAVNNFRFNESPVDLLARLTEAGAPSGPCRASGATTSPARRCPPAGRRLQHVLGQPGVLAHPSRSRATNPWRVPVLRRPRGGTRPSCRPGRAGPGRPRSGRGPG